MTFLTSVADLVQEKKITVKKGVDHLRTHYPNLLTLRSTVSRFKKELFSRGIDGKDAVLTPDEYAMANKIADANLVRKSKDIVEYNVEPLFRWARYRLASPSPEDVMDLTVAIAAVTGRRMVEVALEGRFDFVDDGHVRFSGQAKVRGKTDAYTIPVLAPAKDVINAHKVVLKHFEGLTPTQLNGLHSKALNGQLRTRFPAMTNLTFHGLRMLYALVTFESERPHRYSINAWGMKVLGHADMQQSIYYTRTRILDIAKIDPRKELPPEEKRNPYEEIARQAKKQRR